jgi:hypothetical protein
VIDAPDRAEEPNEGRGGTDGGQHRQSVLQAHGFLVEDFLDRPGEEILRCACLLEFRGAVARMVRLRMHRVRRQVRERIPDPMGGDLVLHGLQRTGVPEHLQELLTARPADHLGDALGHDQIQDTSDISTRMPRSVLLTTSLCATK